MAYPATKQKHGSTMQSSSGTTVDRAESGKPRLRTTYSKQWRVFTILHECSTAEKDAILAHYDANADASFDFTFSGDGQTYTVKYGEAPQARTGQLTFEWEVQSTLVEV